jgi:hypothetical protein
VLVSTIEIIVLYFIFYFLCDSSTVANRGGSQNLLIFILQAHETAFGFNCYEVASDTLSINRTEARIKATHT